jgi:predicted CoA-substrate-specific enzyme activase
LGTQKDGEKFYCGVDVGAATTKVVLLTSARQIAGQAVVKSGVDFAAASREALELALKSAGTDSGQIKYTVATGYGRNNVPYRSQSKTEITCQAKGCYFYFPKEMTIVDIGGQDSKIIKVRRDGSVLNFKMNRKCAAGTGTFLEEIASRLGLAVDRLEELAEKSSTDVELGSYCTVFTQTEILSKIREGVRIEDLAKGAFKSIVKRILEMDTLAQDVVITGGVVAHNRIVAQILSQKLGKEVGIPPFPQVSGALGAAIIAAEVIL